MTPAPVRVWLRGSALTASVAFALVGCSGPEPDFHGAEPVAEVVQAATVGEAVTAGCSTTSVWGLSTQIIEQMNCEIAGGALTEVPTRPNFAKGPATLAWMQPPAVTALVAALDSKPTTTLTANSMLRTVAQQYLLYRWYLDGTCGIALAATPGKSNHESGLAIDVAEHGTWKAALEAQGFSWLGSSDAVHFDFAGAGVVDLTGADVLAFQQLWNANNPGDPIAADGDYGPQTEARLLKSPADGFPIPPSCGVGGSAGAGGGAGTAGAGGAAGATGGGGAGAIAGAAGSPMGGSAGAAGQPSGSATTATSDDSGCGCRSARGRLGSWAALVSLALAAAWRRRRREK